MNSLITLFINRAYAADELVPVTGNVSIAEIFSKVVSTFVLPLIGAACIGAVIYSGILFISSAGDAEKVKKARSSLLWAVLGIIVIVSSYSVIVYLNGLFQ